jgi:heme-degrading monooxygenase HmoA
MFMASFIFKPGNYDAEFFALDGAIEEVATSLEGYVGRKKWLSEDGKTQNSVYYWDNKQALTEFAKHPKHKLAKKQYKKWYDGYHVEIAEVMMSYGDRTLETLTPDIKQRLK